MRRAGLVGALLLAACGKHADDKPADQAAPPAVVASDAAPAPVVTPDAAVAAAAPREGHDFIAEARALATVGACDGGALPAELAIAPELLAAHCTKVKAIQQRYRDGWLKVATPWFAEHVAPTAPTKVVYPFAGGDLSTALTVYPEADEITTLSLEPAGDPRGLATLAHGEMASALGQVVAELHHLYVVNFSNTKDMMNTMRSGRLPTQLILGLSALELHDCEPVSLRYFTIEPDGALTYLTDADVAAAPANDGDEAGVRNKIFANIELQFRKKGSQRIQIYRHIQFNLDDAHLGADDRVLKHLTAKGPVSAMTKAASYLLSWDNFHLIRDYLTSHVVWMVSDATGVAPDWGTPAGFEYETWGSYQSSHMDAGKGIQSHWRKLFESQPARPLPFRFGYPDGTHLSSHLVIMRKPGT